MLLVVPSRISNSTVVSTERIPQPAGEEQDRHSWQDASIESPHSGGQRTDQ